jgi:hypothetical protein
MPDSEHTLNVLNHLLAIHNRSLPVYLRSAPPWTGRNGEAGLQVLSSIADAQFAMVDRIGSLIIELRGVVRYGEFPHRFADWHDLSLEFILAKTYDLQQLDIERIGKCVSWLDDSPRAKALAQEALGEARAHLEALAELMGKAVS